ncbi:unnamed protein product, partial [Ectocarpus sp. 8 AP-2014]
MGVVIRPLHRCSQTNRVVVGKANHHDTRAARSCGGVHVCYVVGCVTFYCCGYIIYCHLEGLADYRLERTERAGFKAGVIVVIIAHIDKVGRSVQLMYPEMYRSHTMCEAWPGHVWGEW